MSDSVSMEHSADAHSSPSSYLSVDCIPSSHTSLESDAIEESIVRCPRPQSGNADIQIVDISTAPPSSQTPPSSSEASTIEAQRSQGRDDGRGQTSGMHLELSSQIPLTPAASEESTIKPPRSQTGEDGRDEPTGLLELNIETQEEQQEFLKEIQDGFVSKVIPKEMELWDDLLGESLATASEYSSLDGKHVHTKHEQAHKLWFHLHKLSVDDFKTKVFPELRRRFPHVVASSRFLGPRSQSARVRFADSPPCLRHELIRKVKCMKLARWLYQCDGITLDFYNELFTDSSRIPTAQLWNRIFSAFPSSSSAVIGKLRQRLETKLAVVQDLEQQMRDGMPCTCQCPSHDVAPPDLRGMVEEETGEVDSSISGGEEDWRWCENHHPRSFQSPGSHYLGSDDPSLCLSSLDPEFHRWADGQGLSEGTLLMLLREGLASKEDLARLSVDEVQEFLPLYSTLQGKQKLELKKVIRQLSSEASSPSSVDMAPTIPTGSVAMETAPSPTTAVATTMAVSPPDLSSMFEDGEKCRLLVTGGTGCGKSHSCNTMMGKNLFSTNLGMGSHTKNFQYEQSRNQRLELMDSPGLWDTSMSLEEVCTIMVHALVALHPDPSAIVYTLKIGDKYTDEEFQTFQSLKLIFGQEMCRHTIILFTHGDVLKKAGKTMEQYLQESPDRFKDVLRECGSRYAVLDNTDLAANTQQLRKLRDMVRDITSRPNEGHFKLPNFPTHKESIAREIHRLLRSNPAGGEFGAKCTLMKEGEEGKGDGDGSGKRSVWQMIMDAIRPIIEWLFSNWGAAAGGCG